MLLMRLLTGLLLFAFTTLCAAQVEVSGGRYNALPDGSQLVFELSGPTAYRSFMLNNPPRLVIDLKRASSRGLRHGLSSADFQGLRSGTHDDGDLRLVVDLSRDMFGKATIFQQHGLLLVVDLFRNRPMVLQHPDSVAYAVPQILAQPVIPASQTAMASIATLPAIEMVSRPTTPPITTGSPAPATVPASASRQTVIEPPTVVSRVEPGPRPAPPVRVQRRDILIAIDPGHGGRDPGAIGPGGTREKKVVLEIAQRLKRLIDAEAGMSAFLTRSDDRYLRLYQRISIARQRRADLFISIHADAFTNPRPRGASIYMLSTRGASSTMASWLAESENKSDLIEPELNIPDQQLRQIVFDMVHDAVLADSNEVGGKILRELGQVGRLHSHKVERANFAVLRSPDIPSVLVETGFISNPEEERLLNTSSHQQKIAEAILQGIQSYRNARPGLGMEIVEAGTRSPTRPYTVRRGDTLSAIAQRHDVSLANLIAINGLDNANSIAAGMTLQIPEG